MGRRAGAAPLVPAGDSLGAGAISRRRRRDRHLRGDGGRPVLAEHPLRPDPALPRSRGSRGALRDRPGSLGRRFPRPSRRRSLARGVRCPGAARAGVRLRRRGPGSAQAYLAPPFRSTPGPRSRARGRARTLALLPAGPAHGLQRHLPRDQRRPLSDRRARAALGARPGAGVRRAGGRPSGPVREPGERWARRSGGDGGHPLARPPAARPDRRLEIARRGAGDRIRRQRGARRAGGAPRRGGGRVAGPLPGLAPAGSRGAARLRCRRGHRRVFPSTFGGRHVRAGNRPR